MSFTTNDIPLINPDVHDTGCHWYSGPSGNQKWWEGRTKSGCGWNVDHAGYNDHSHYLTWDNPNAYCPQYGPITNVTYSGDNSQKIKCTYSSINSPLVFDTEVAKSFTNDVVNGQQGYRKNFCMATNDPSVLVQQKDNCLQYFGGGNETVFNGRVLDLCAALPNNGWQSVPVCVDVARQSVNSSGGNTQVGYDMMSKWCRGGDGHSDKKGMGPGRTANDPRCACFNVRDYGFKDADSCIADNRKNLEGCNRLHDRLKNFIESGGPGLQVIKAMNVDTGCLSQDCALSKEQGDATDIFPYEDQGVSCGDVTLNVCNIDINQRVAMNSAVKAECNFPSDSGSGGGGGGSATPGASGAPGASPFDEDARMLPVTWGPFARIFDTETKQYAFMSSCCVTCILLVVLLIFMMKGSGPSGPSSQNLLAARLASI
jgi:hypothetical protein